VPIWFAEVNRALAARVCQRASVSSSRKPPGCWLPTRHGANQKGTNCRGV